MALLTSQSFFDGADLHGPTAVRITEGRVVSIDPHHGECDHHLLAPGFVDLQVNGFGEIDVAGASVDGLAHLDAELAATGTTSWAGTLISAPLDRIDASLRTLSDSTSKGAVPGLLGVHLEGPFLGGAPGAHRKDRIIPIDMEWLGNLPDIVRIVTLAAEQDQAPRATALLHNKGVTVSIGHSRPTRAQFTATVNEGASMVTHVFNGMSGVQHRDGGLALWAMVDPAVTMGAIADLVHVNADALSLIFSVDARPRVALVSDTVGWESSWSRHAGIRIVDGAPRLPDGTLAGSSTPLALGVRNAVLRAGVSLRSSLAAATSVPATLVGSSTLGRVRVGGPANLVLLDDDLTVVGHRRRLPSGRA